MILHLTKLALCQKNDPDNSGDDSVVILTSINEGVDGASVFSIESPAEYLTIGSGDSVGSLKTHTIDVRTLKPTDDVYSGKTSLQKIKDWADNQTELYLCARTLDGFVFMGDYQTEEGLCVITMNEQLSENDVLAFKITSKSIIGFDSSTGLHEGGFWAGENGVQGYNWGDSDSSNVADGWGSFGADVESFANGEQTLQTNNTGVSSFFKNVFYPFEGDSLTLSFDLVSLTGTATVNTVVFRCKDKSDSTIGSDTREGASVGRNYATRIIPSGTVYLQLRYEYLPASGDITLVIKDPMLRTSTATNYTKF